MSGESTATPKIFQRGYPYGSGDVLVLGPEVFVSEDRSVICYQGVNYYRPADWNAPLPIAR